MDPFVLEGRSGLDEGKKIRSFREYLGARKDCEM